MTDAILVTGATGTVGRKVVKALAAKGLDVRAGVHTPETTEGRQKADDLRREHVEPVEFDFGNPATFVPAMKGASHLFLLTPFAPGETEVVAAVLEAAKEAGVGHVVRLSVFGAEQEPGHLIGRWHREAEKVLQASGLPWTILRPSQFMQNFAGNMKPQDGKIAMALADAKVAYIDVRDIAAVAAITLSDECHVGKIYTLTGPEAITMTQVAEAITKAAGKTVEYVPVTEKDVIDWLTQQKMPEWAVQAITELQAFWRAGNGTIPTTDVKDVAGCEPTTFEKFAQDYAGKF